MSRQRYAWLLTIIWCVSWGFYIYSTWEAQKTLPLNAWGDFFAGMFAPLAFLWLVIGYFQQGEELKQNTEALKMQAEVLKLQNDELKSSVAQQKMLAEINRDELEHLKREAAYRYQKEKISAKAKFICKGAKVSGLSGRFTFINEGADAARVSIELSPADQKITGCVVVEPGFIAYWNRGVENKIDLVINQEIEHASSKDFSITFKYQDGLGEFVEAHFISGIDSHGNIRMASIVT